MIKKRLVVANGEYTARDGSVKKRWVEIGQVHEGSKGDYITLDAHINLAAFPRKEGDNRVYANLFDYDRDQKGANGAAPQSNFEDDQDLPF